MNKSAYMQHLGAIYWHLELLINQSDKELLLINQIHNQVQGLIKDMESKL